MRRRPSFVSLLCVGVLGLFLHVTQSQAEPTLQQICDSWFGANSVKVGATTHRQVFPAGTYDFTLVGRNSGNGSTQVGWYQSGAPLQFNSIFDALALPGSTATFTIPVAFGLRSNVCCATPPGPWYSQSAYNADGYDHYQTYDICTDYYATNGLAGYVAVAMEDAQGGGDQDFNDIVFYFVQSAPHCALDVGGVGRGDSGPHIASDKLGGAFVTWKDYRAGETSPRMYVERVTSGLELAAGWPAGGLAMGTSPGSHYFGTITDDGAGGAITVWLNSLSQLYAQRVTAGGQRLWPSAGVPLEVQPAGAMGFPHITKAGLGGCVAAWDDYRSGNANADVYAQKLSANGGQLWGTFGVPLCTAARSQYPGGVIATNDGGAIVVWSDLRNDDGSSTNQDIYAQRLDSLGSPVWAGNGIPVCAVPGVQQLSSLTSDGAGGAIIAWTNVPTGEAIVQRVDAGGILRWPSDGIDVLPVPNASYGPGIVSDGQGGALIVSSIYAQRLGPTGTKLWGQSGVMTQPGGWSQYGASIVPDGIGGGYVTWGEDYRRCSGGTAYVQRLSRTSGLMAGWPPAADSVCLGFGDQGAVVIDADGAGGVVAAWREYTRSSGTYSIRVGHIQGSPLTTGVGEGPTARSIGVPCRVRPSPTDGATRISFDLDHRSTVSCWIGDVAGRIVRKVIYRQELNAGEQSCGWDGRDSEGTIVPNGIYFVRVDVDGLVSPGKVVVFR